MRAALALVLLLGACSQGEPVARPDAAGLALENAAVAVGMVRDPATTEIAGLYGRETDRLCVTGGEGGYRIGVSIDLGDQGCSATGTLTRRGEALAVAFAAAPGCRFDARADQDRIVFPASLPAGCERLCTDRASLAAMDVALMSEGQAEAASLRDRQGRLLCGS